MTREELIKKMANAISDLRWQARTDKQVAAAALTALESALPGLSDVVEGKAVIVPRGPAFDVDGAIQFLRKQAEEWNRAFPPTKE